MLLEKISHSPLYKISSISFTFPNPSATYSNVDASRAMKGLVAVAGCAKTNLGIGNHFTFAVIFSVEKAVQDRLKAIDPCLLLEYPVLDSAKSWGRKLQFPEVMKSF